MRAKATPPDEPGNFTHVLTSAATAPTPAGLGANSVFAYGSKAVGTKPHRKVRKNTMRDLLIKTLEACGELNTGGIAEAMGISLHNAADLAWKMAQADLIAYTERGGRKYYRSVAASAIGFQSSLEKGNGVQEAPATSAMPDRRVELLPAEEAAEVKQPANAIQHGGHHYKGLPIEPWDYIAANDIGFLEGNAIKYLSRWKSKNGVEDLHKALHYVQKAIEVNSTTVGSTGEKTK